MSWGSKFTFKNWQCVRQSFELASDHILKIGHFFGMEARHPEDLRKSTQPAANYFWNVWVKNINGFEFDEPLPILDRSILSTNQPKNGPGDPRECAIHGCPGAQATAGDPIDTRTGNFDYSLVDLSLQTIAGPLTFQRSYASLAADPSLYPMDLGFAWTHNQDTRLIFEPGLVWFKAHTQNQYQFIDNGNGAYTPYPGVLASLTYNSGDSTYSLIASDQSVYNFNASGQLFTWRNELGYGFDYTYSNGRLYRVTEPTSGRFLQFNYQGGHLTSVNDHTSRQVVFDYDANGDLITFTDARGKSWPYEYDGASHHLKTLKDPATSPKTILSVSYDPQGRAYEQFNGKGERIVKIGFNEDGSSTILDALERTSTDIYDGRHTNVIQTDPSGNTIYKTFDANFRPTQIQEIGKSTSLGLLWSSDGASLNSIKDAAGYETSLEYNGQNHVISVVDPRSQATNFNYTGALLGSTVHHTSSGDITTTYTYTTVEDAPQPAGLLKTVTDPLNHTTSYTYYPSGELESTTNAKNEVTSFTYYTTGLVENVTDPLGRVTRYDYDANGNVRWVIRNYDENRPANDENQYNLTEEYRYDQQGRLEYKVDTLSRITQYIYNDAGQVWKEIKPLGQTTTYEYNSTGQLTNIFDPLGHKTSYVYDPSIGWLTQVKDNLGRTIHSYSYNNDGTIHTETRPTPEGDYTITYETYDPLKRPTRVIDNEDRWSEVSYDAYDNPLTRTDALGRVTKYEYNDLGLLKSVMENFKENPDPGDDPFATNVRTEYTYDNAGNLKTITDANSHVTTFGYDPLNRLETTTDHLQQVTRYQYDTLQNKKSITDNEGITVDYYYDLADRLDVIDYPVGAPDVRFDHDPLGRLTDMYDGLGRTHWIYDDLDRITSITDPFNQTVGYGYDADNKPTSITYPAPVSKTISYQYNSLDQLENVLEGATLLVHYTYDSAGRLSQTSRANGVNTTYTYYLGGRLETLTHQNNLSQLASYHYHYYPVGNVDIVDEMVVYPHFTFLPVITNEEGGGLEGLGELPENGGLSSEGFPSPGYPAPLEGSQSQLETGDSPLVNPEDSYPAPDSLPQSKVTSLLQRLWNFVSRLFNNDVRPVFAETSLFSSYPPPAPPEGGNPPAQNHTIDYGYDPLNRMTSAVYSEGKTYAYTYDKVGNRTSQKIDGVETVYTYDELNRLTNAGGVAFTWDANGNLLNDGTNVYSYDFANRLTGINGQGSTHSFGYDGLGNRYQQTANGETTTYLLDLSDDLSQVLSDGTTAYYYGLERLAQQVNGGDYEYFLTDSLGSVRQLSGANGFLSFAQSFDSYGKIIAQTGYSDNKYGFAGEMGAPSGLLFLRARYYSPVTGRFITRDPFPGVINQPATLNPYVYALNNPALYTDPSGEFVLPFIAAAAIGGAISAGANVVGQMLTMGPGDFGQKLRCLDWGQVGLSFAAGAVAGFAGFTVFGGAIALFGTGFLANVAAGAISGIVAGQYGILTYLTLSGHTDQLRGSLFRWQDVVRDAALGGIFGGIGYRIGRLSGPNKPIINSRGVPYPEVDVPGYGKVPFPDSPYSPNNSPSRAQEFTNALKKAFQSWWKNQGYIWPEGEVHIHHIKPLQYGGTNIFENLVPLSRPQHDLFTNWWRYFE